MNSEELVMWKVQGKGFLVKKTAPAKTRETTDLICLRNRMNSVWWEGGNEDKNCRGDPREQGLHEQIMQDLIGPGKELRLHWKCSARWLEGVTLISLGDVVI